MRYLILGAFVFSAPCKMAFIGGGRGSSEGTSEALLFRQSNREVQPMEEIKNTLSRRQFVTLLGTTATAGLTLLSMTGCGGGGEGAASSSAAAVGDPVKGGTFKVALNRTISAKSLDPLYVDSTTADQVCQNYGDTLVQENFDQSEYLPCDRHQMGDLRRRQGLHLHHPRRRSLPARQVPGRPSADRRGRRVIHQPR